MFFQEDLKVRKVTFVLGISSNKEYFEFYTDAPEDAVELAWTYATDNYAPRRNIDECRNVKNRILDAIRNMGFEISEEIPHNQYKIVHNS